MALELRIIKDPCRHLSKPRTRAFGTVGGNIGRAPDSYWVLPDPNGYVSSHHCSVEYRDGSYWLRDESRNGVFVNGAPSPIGRGNEVQLSHGDRLRLAQYEILVRMTSRVPDGVVEPPEHDGAQRIGNGADFTTTGEHADSVALAGVDPGKTQGFAALGDTAGFHGTDQTQSRRAPDWSGSTHPSLEADAGEISAGLAEQPDRTMPSEPRTFIETAIKRVRFSEMARAARDSVSAPSPSVRAATAERAAVDSAPALVETPTARPVEREIASAPAPVQSSATAPRSHRAATTNVEAMRKYCILPGLDDEGVVRAYKILRTRVRRRMLAQQWRSVGVTGASEGVGKTVTSINLAITFARDSRTPVVLIDLDLYRPKVGNYLGVQFDKGLADYLLGEAEIEDIVYSTDIQGLNLIPNGRALPDGSELLASSRMSDLVRYLESESPQRTLIYDLPPLMMSDDVLVFSAHMDCVLDVVAVGITPRALLQRSQEIFAELNVVGVVLNRATEQDQAGRYYY